MEVVRKMKKNTAKIIFIIIFIILILCVLPNNIFSANVINPNDYKPDSTTEASNAGELANIGNSIVGVLQVIGAGVSVIILAVLGIKYMTGSVEERAQYKKTMVPYLIGAVMVFAITTILKIIIDVAGII